MLSDADVLSIVAAELSNSTGGYTGLSNNPGLEESLDYYLGNPNGRESQGKSSVVSTDVADAIEWILPQVMKSFTQNNEVVIFDPVHAEDEFQAELESEYVYDVLMKQNNGFILIHQFVKDALMQNNGILKAYVEDEEKTKTDHYTGIGQNQLDVLLGAENVELMELTDSMDDSGNIMFDVKVSITSTNKKICIDPVPPEEFRLSSNHNSIDLSDCRFSAHVFLKTASYLKEIGVSDEEIDKMPMGEQSYDRDYRFSAQGENYDYSDVNPDRTMRLIEISECFMFMDYNEDGIAEMVKVTVAGGDSPTIVISVEEISEMPWVASTAILMSHKFKGLSIFDRLKQIQDQKTALLRNLLDNLYLQNNQRSIVVEGQVNIDDILINRSGGIIRAKTLDAYQPIMTPQLGAESYNMLGYLDQIAAGRVGVSPEGGATPENIGDRVGSQGVERMMNAKEELVGLIIRVIAETGMKPLCTKIRNLSVKHIDAVKDYRFRGQWQKINPSEWLDRTMTTVRVGTGTGNHQAQVGSIMNLFEMQKLLAESNQYALTNGQKIYDTIDKFCKYSELNGANSYFIDPSSEEGKAEQEKLDKSNSENKQKEEEMQMAQLKMQADLAKAEMQKAEAQMLNTQLKAEIDNGKNQLTLQKQAADNEISVLETQLSEAKLYSDSAGRSGELQFRYDEMETRNAIEMLRIEKETQQTEENENYEENKETIGESANGSE